ncbi:MAG TPA: flagellar basal body L-ring protein FlgH [Ghiorsea sp.]|nr:flagellar basal body L-ring protein FlgH [Ghiorsea sp.]HIP06583.1 flagellar basal body L-ring protein FlgH [Mariprofundaceae bacterium]
MQYEPANTQTGSLWNNSGSTMFTDPKAHRIGDLVMVLVQETASATRSLGTKKSRKSKHKSSLAGMIGLEKNILPNFNPELAMNISNDKSFVGSGETTNSDSLIANVTAVVTEVYPNGNMKIIGRREVTINQQPQELTFMGIIRPSDISANNTIISAQVAQAKISYGSGGSLAAMSDEGWLGQTLDVLWPF